MSLMSRFSRSPGPGKLPRRYGPSPGDLSYTERKARSLLRSSQLDLALTSFSLSSSPPSLSLSLSVRVRRISRIVESANCRSMFAECASIVVRLWPRINRADRHRKDRSDPIDRPRR